MKDRELFRIGEVSKLFHVSISILRHYDKIGLLCPEYTDSETGYRYYSTRQFECLNTIRYLRALDIPLDEISKVIKNRNTDDIANLLLRQRKEVIKRKNELEMIERKIDNRLKQLQDALSSEIGVIKEEIKGERRLALINKKLAPKNYLDLEHSIREIEKTEKTPVTFLGKVGVGISENNLNEHRYKAYDMVFIILEEEDSFKGSTILLPAESCVTVRFRGGHENAPRYYEMLIKYIENNKYKISGFSKEITMIDYGLTDDVSKFVTEIQIPVEK